MRRLRWLAGSVGLAVLLAVGLAPAGIVSVVTVPVPLPLAVQ